MGGGEWAMENNPVSGSRCQGHARCAAAGDGATNERTRGGGDGESRGGGDVAARG